MECIEELIYNLFNYIPIYPEEISAKDLASKLGISTQRVTGLVNTSSSQCLVAESFKKKAMTYYTYLDKKSKDKTLNFLKTGGDDARSR